MLTLSRLIGFIAIAAAAFTVATGLASLSTPAKATAAPILEDVSVSCVVSDADAGALLTLAPNRTVDFDLAGEVGMSVACGSPRNAASPAAFGPGQAAGKGDFGLL